MATKKSAPKTGGDPANGYILKIQLDLTKPPVWRRVAIPTGLNLADLHAIIQRAMGWENCHLHRFMVADVDYYDLSYDPDPPADAADEQDAQLDELLEKPGQKLAYTYDFGDDWEHTILFEGHAPKPVSLPQVIKGVGACPPEDCGGIFGYKDLLKLLARQAAQKPIHVSEIETLEWIGNFDPLAFDLDAANDALAAWNRERTAAFDAKLIPFPTPPTAPKD